MYYKKLVGNKIYLSPCDIENETKILTVWMNEDEELAIYNGFYGSLVGEEKVKEMLLKWNEGPFLFSIINLETNEFMGQVSFFGIDSHEQYATMGIFLGKDYRKKGYGKEAIQLAIDYLFKTQRFNAIHLEVFSYNQNAYEMYRKFGFKECGRWHQVRYHDGISQDIILMELLREEYIK